MTEAVRLIDSATTPGPAAARVTVDLERAVGEVDPRIYGSFVEHLGRCVYGGIFDEGSPLSDDQGFRLDVLDALRELRPPVIRWPGGNFVSGYHWMDGVGPRDGRRLRWDRAWQVEESNRFGTDEFMELCRRLDAEPYLCFNMGTGTLDEAAAWVEYCNGDRRTDEAELRRQNGHREPYRVRYWGLGNEMWGPWQLGQLSPDEYVARAREMAKIVRRTDPEIELVGCGQVGWSEWDRIVIDGLAPIMDWFSVHLYTGSADHYRNALMPHQAERALETSRVLLDRARYLQEVEHPIHVAYDEWNQWFRREQIGNSHEDVYTLSDAVAVATYLNVFVRHCKTVRMANLAQAVNVIAPIRTSPEGLYLQTIYHPLRLYSQLMRGTALDVHVNSPSYDLNAKEEAGSRHRVADLGPFNLLDASAVRDRRGKLILAVVNRDPRRALRTAVVVRGAAALQGGVQHVVTGPSPDSVNSFEEPDQVNVEDRPVKSEGPVFVVDLQPHTVSVFELGVDAAQQWK